MRDYSVLAESYKDAFGLLPSLEYLENLSDEGLDLLNESIERRIREENARDRQEDAKFFNDLVDRLDKLAKDSNVSRATALRWLQDAEGAFDDIGYFLYCNGINGLEYEAKLKEFVDA